MKPRSQLRCSEKGVTLVNTGSITGRIQPRNPTPLDLGDCWPGPSLRIVQPRTERAFQAHRQQKVNASGGPTMQRQARFRIASCLLLPMLAVLDSGCATTKVVGTSIQRVVNRQPVDRDIIEKAITADAQSVAVNVRQLSRRFAEALAQLRAQVKARWGQNDTKVAERTVYVKYTQGYQSRVITDFDHGLLTVETLDVADPKKSLRIALVTALLTSSDPSSVDLFTDKDVILDPQRRPYLYGLVNDNHGKPISNRVQAERYAEFLVSKRARTRPVQSEQGSSTALLVTLNMVKNFEAKGAQRYYASVEKYSTQYGVSPSLVMAIIRTESNFNPFAVSGAPAYGLMQLVPTSGGREAMKRARGIDQAPTTEALFDADRNIELGTAYLSVLSEAEFRPVANPESRDYCVIAAYNTGPRNVTRTFHREKSEALRSINGMPPRDLYDRLRTGLPAEETRQYLAKVTGYRAQFTNAGAARIAGLGRVSADR